MTYRERLPSGCPPAEAEEIGAAREVFRLVDTNPPTDADFASQRALRPGKIFPGVTECQARGLSVHTDVSDSKKVLKLPAHRGRQICRVRLEPGAGHIQQTGPRSHHTWWPLADYDILTRCRVEDA